MRDNCNFRSTTKLCSRKSYFASTSEQRLYQWIGHPNRAPLSSPHRKPHSVIVQSFNLHRSLRRSSEFASPRVGRARSSKLNEPLAPNSLLPFTSLDRHLVMYWFSQLSLRSGCQQLYP
ncbi:unnamed protein product [Periconia digitata]|uniref:Uncharacterized protein n=1 Tax=Periconia digitata TaxID=1303443 RepID=A0A9W4UFZ0_9PLEO|nr:unnamed protein product [Periconia digitata]